MTDTVGSPTSATPENPVPYSLEIEHDDYSKYLLYSRTEILFVLRSALQKGCMLTVYFDAGRRFFLSALLSLSDDGNWLYLDQGSDAATNQRALAADKLLLTTVLDKVKIQFTLAGLQLSQSGDRAIFAARIPETLLRLQRREYFRLPTPIVNPLTCLMNVVLVDGSLATADATVVDISGGGVGLQLPAGLNAKFDVGTLIPDCKISLPDEGLLVMSLCVRNCFNAGRPGHEHLRLGCEFVDLAGTRLTMIQRYITRIERERKARTTSGQ